jgi:hypothetical protein
MDNKTIYFRTSKGEDEMQSKTTHLPGDIRRALLMVDGNATFGEISKRAAPSLRASLDEMFEELEKDGFIQEKVQSKTGKNQDKARSENIPKMSVPVKMATPHKTQPVDDDGELNFMGGFNARSPEMPAAKNPAADKSEKLKDEADDNAIRELAAAKFSAQLEAEAILLKAEQDAARIREETVSRAKAEAEATRIKIEQEARRVRDELAAAKLRTEQEARLRLEAAAKAQQQAEAARIKAEQEAEQMRIELEEARIRAEQEARIRLEATAKAQARIKAEDEADKAREEAARIARQEAAKVREEAERIARQEQRVREESERLIRQEQEAAKAREEAERIARHEQRVREETERIIRQEQEAAKAREEAERNIRHEQRVREETERIIRQEQEAARARGAAARDEKASEQIPRAPDTPAAKPSAFSFDSFEVDDPQYTSESHIEKQPDQKAKQPVKKEKVAPVKAAPAGKTGAFAFDTFDVDEPPAQVEPVRNKQAAQQARPAQQPAAAEKTDRSGEGRRADRQQQVSPTAANKPADGKPSQEQIQRAKQERIAVEQRMAAEALEAKKIAEAQARVWAEAEQRAHQAAKAEAEQATKKSMQQVTFAAADSPVVAKPAPVARPIRKTFPWGRLAGFMFKLGSFLLVLLIGALFVIPYFVPMRDYMPKAEQMLSAKLHQPVHIGRLSGRILPMPRLEVGEIYIGDAKQFQADEAKINFALTGIFTDEKPVTSIEFQGFKVRGAWLTNVAEWLQKMANEEMYPVSRMVFSQGTLDADVFELTGIEGTLDFGPNGKFTQTNLRANAGKYALGISVSPEDRLQATLAVHGSALPLLPNWTFDELTAKGELNKNELVVSNFEGRLMGGSLQGNASINWHSGWRAQGALNAKGINMQNFSKLLDGNAEGSARFKMTSLDLKGLADSVTLDGGFSSKDGTISGLEIVKTARTRSKENLPGGRTHYDSLNGIVSFENGVYHINQMKINASGLAANATFEVDAIKQQLSGKMNVSLSLPDTGPPVDLQIGGLVSSPTLIYAH